MNVNIHKLNHREVPEVLRRVASPPKQLYWAGVPPAGLLAKPRVGIVGSRKATLYGRYVTGKLAEQLSHSGVVIISGLAFGIDSIAHNACLVAKGQTIAVLPRSIEEVYPASHFHLAKQILSSNGALVSEYQLGTDARRENFIARNRLISGLSDVLVVVEATKKSGSLHTARFALEQGKTVMAVPGNINSPTSEGCNNLIKSGALPVTKVEDILFALGLKFNPTKPAKLLLDSPQQEQLFDLISSGTSDQEALATASHLTVPEISSTLTTLELQGYIRPVGGGHWTIA